MTIKSTKSLLIGAMASLALSLGVSDALAQAPIPNPNGVAEGGFNTGENSIYRTPTSPATNGTVTGGTIRMRNSNGKITGKWGLSEGNRMPGIVIWYCKSTIPGGTFFTDLGTGGNQVVTVGPGEVNISGEYKPGKGDPNPDNPEGKRQYPEGSTIVFAGNDPAKPQTIPAENPDNTVDGTGAPGKGFDVVKLTGDAPKNTKKCDEGATHIQQLEQTGGLFTNKGNLVLGNRANSPHSIVDMTNDVEGTGTCGITLVNGGTMNIAKTYTNVNGFWKLEPTSNVNMTGVFDYQAGNMDFACNSNFHYNNAEAGTKQRIFKTEGTKAPDGTITGFYAYGNLKLSGGEKNTNGDFNVCNDLFTTSEVNIIDRSGADPVIYTATLLNETPGNHVFFNLDGGTAETTVEIEGNVKYKNVPINTLLTFNNKDTKVQFEEANNLNFALSVQPKIKPDKMNDYDVTNDVNRKINITYDGTGKISHLQASWEDTDEGAGFIAPTPAVPARFAEGYNDAQKRKKVIRVGATYDINQATLDARIVKYSKTDAPADGINLVAEAAPAAPQTADLIAFSRKLFSGSDLLLSTKPQDVVSVMNGRWSDPQTWDTGVEPASSDIVTLETTVWVGSEGPHFGGRQFTDNERAITNAGATDDSRFAAKSITIADKENAGLYIIMDDPDLASVTGNEKLFQTHMRGNFGEVGIYNKNTRSHEENQGTTGTGMNGLFISAVTNTYIPVVGAAIFDNQGTFTNLGVTEVGECY